MHVKVTQQPMEILNCEDKRKIKDKCEDKRKFKVSRNIGTDQHLKKALSSHISYNSLRVGSPDRIMSIRKKNPNSPLAL